MEVGCYVYFVVSGVKEVYGCLFDVYEEFVVVVVDGLYFVMLFFEEVEGLVFVLVGGQLGGLFGVFFVGFEVLLQGGGFGGGVDIEMVVDIGGGFFEGIEDGDGEVIDREGVLVIFLDEGVEFVQLVCVFFGVCFEVGEVVLWCLVKIFCEVYMFQIQICVCVVVEVVDLVGFIDVNVI